MGLTLVKGSTWDSHENLLVNTVADLTNVLEQKDIMITRGHTVATDNGGGAFVYQSSLARSNHNGGTIIDATGSGVGNGCWLREYVPSRFSLCFFGSDDTTTDNLLAEYGVIDAAVFISSLNGGMFIFDVSKINSHDGIDNFNGWIRQSDSSLRRDLQAITGLIKLGSGEYTSGQIYSTYNQYIYGSDGFSVYIVKPGVNLPYAIDPVTYPGVEDDPNLIKYIANTDHEMHEETVTLSDGQQTVAYSVYQVEKATFYLRGTGTDQGRILEGVDYFKNVGANEIVLTESQPEGTQCTLVMHDVQSSSTDPGDIFPLGGYSEWIGTNLIVNASAYNHIHIATGTLSFINIPEEAYSCTCLIDGNTITWPAGITWLPENTPPVLTANTDIVMLVTEDQGVTWLGTSILGA